MKWTQQQYAGTVALTVVSLACGGTPMPDATGAARSAGDPVFQVDPLWPKALPEDRMFDNVVGVATDSQDNVWSEIEGGDREGSGVGYLNLGWTLNEKASIGVEFNVARQGPLTFNKDIAPILLEHCAPCHRQGQPTPLQLIEYQEVRRHARQIAAVTKSQLMPPWPPERGYGEFTNERTLRDEQIEMIQRWVGEGAIEGDPADKPEIPGWPEGWQLGEPDLILRMPEPYTVQADGTDVFRNFVIPVPLSETRYVRGVEFRPDNQRVLHHASVGIDLTRSARRMDRDDPEPGFSAMTDDVDNVFGWTPGKTPVLEPDDWAWPLEKGSDVVIQLHMLPTGRAEVIQPSVGLFFTDTPPSHAPLLLKLESKTIDIPAGQADYAIEDSYVLPANVDVLSVYPHAHYLGKEIKGFATLPDGTVKWLIWIKTWDFRWQDHYRYAVPVFLPKGTTLTMHFTYDNSEKNVRNPHQPPRRVLWGPRSLDEMGVLWLRVLPRRSNDVDVLVRDSVQRTLRVEIAGAEMQVRATPGDASAHNFLATNYLRAGLVKEAMAELEEALRLEPTHAEARSNLASALQVQGRLAEALQQLREASRLEPEDDRVRFNLANVLQASGRMEEAIREFQRAVQINPDNADAHFNLALVLGSQNKLDEAIAHFRQVIEINPQHGVAHRNLGVALRLQGKLDEALEETRAALRIEPGSTEAQKDLALLLKIKSLRR